MLLNVALRRFSSPARLLLWCAIGTAFVQVVLVRLSPGDPHGFSPAFWYLLTAYDTHGNALLLVLAVCAFLLRRRPAAIAAARFAAERPWTLACAAFLLLCLGSLRVYHDYPLSMDEYSTAFQAKIFAAGKLTGTFPPDLIDRLVPRFLQNVFLTVSRSSGEVSSSYWPGFALVLTPFVWLGIPWAANPALGALTLAALHRLMREITGSRDAAGWAVVLTAASPAFIVASISYYSMAAHLFCNLLFALLLLRPTAARALLAGFVGSLALTLHNPVPHLLFALPFFVWLFFRRESTALLGALLLGYLPLAGLLGIGWHHHLAELANTASVTQPTTAAPPMLDRVSAQIAALLTLPSSGIVEARIAGLSKVWTWGAAGLMVLAAYGYVAARAQTGVRLLGAALAITFFAYFFIAFDQGHGWGYRYIHSAWFVLPVFAAIALSGAGGNEVAELRNMACWAAILSLVFANALRLVQVEAFIGQHLSQVPPLARPVDPARPEVVFVNVGTGFYTHDMVQNDPFLRAPRITMVQVSRDDDAELMTRRFPGYVRGAEGRWGELWIATPATPSRP